MTSPYFSDSISVSCPIASNENGSFTTISFSVTNIINSITCTVNKNGYLFVNPIVSTNVTLPSGKSTILQGNQGAGGNYVYSFQQYFLNANISFRPDYENATNTYTVSFSISGTGTFEYNTTTKQFYRV